MKTGKYPLEFFCSLGDFYATEALLKAGANISIITSQKQTLPRLFIKSFSTADNQISLLRLLSDKGYDLSQSCAIHRETVLMYTIRQRAEQTIKFLVEECVVDLQNAEQLAATLANRFRVIDPFFIGISHYIKQQRTRKIS